MSVVERALAKLKGVPVPEASTGQRRVAATVTRGAPEPEKEISKVATGAIACRDDRSVEFDTAALTEAGMLAKDNLRLADEYRAIKQPILRKCVLSKTEGPRENCLIQVTSALPGEGKTFNSINLGLSLAQEHDWSVLLVDTDCRNPSFSRTLGLYQESGLLDYLTDPTAKLESYVLSSSVKNLFLLPLGKSDPQASELLGSDRMRSTCDDLMKGRYGPLIVIFDTSPLLLTPEPVVISELVGQILVVVRANSTSRPAVADAVGKLGTEKSIGMILNQADVNDRLASFSYGYSYTSAYGSQ